MSIFRKKYTGKLVLRQWTASVFGASAANKQLQATQFACYS